MADEAPGTPPASPPAAPKPAAKPRAKPTAPKAPPAAPKTASPAPKVVAKSASPKKSPAPAAPAKPAAPKGTVIDASGLVLGRAASVIAHRLLKGEHITVVNSERSIVTGGRANVIGFYTANRARGSVRTGPHYPRYPDRIFRRTVRGMLPHLKTRGKEALDRLDVFIGVPAALSGTATQSIDLARPSPSLRAPLTLQEITRLLGARV